METVHRNQNMLIAFLFVCFVMAEPTETATVAHEAFPTFVLRAFLDYIYLVG